jgi:hypothetical protein
MELKPSHEMFVRALIDNKGNATQAYMQVFPQAKYSSARHSASILLTNVYIKQRFLEILETNGLGLQDVAKKLSKYMNAKIIYRNLKGEESAYDDKETQFKALNLILRLYDSLSKLESVLRLTPEQLAQLAKEQEIVRSEETR